MMIEESFESLLRQHQEGYQVSHCGPLNNSRRKRVMKLAQCAVKLSGWDEEAAAYLEARIQSVLEEKED